MSRWRGPSWLRGWLQAWALLGLALWFGGFTFYSGIVLPILHQHWDSLEVGLMITPQVTARLNQIGATTLIPWWLWVASPPDKRSARLPILARGLLVALSVGLASLFWLHAKMTEHLDVRGLIGFYPWHRAYLAVSTGLWGLQAILLVTIARNASISRGELDLLRSDQSTVAKNEGQ